MIGLYIAFRNDMSMLLLSVFAGLVPVSLGSAMYSIKTKGGFEMASPGKYLLLSAIVGVLFAVGVYYGGNYFLHDYQNKQ